MFNYHSLIPWGSFRGRQEEKWGSFRGRDHFGGCTVPLLFEASLRGRPSDPPTLRALVFPIPLLFGRLPGHSVLRQVVTKILSIATSVRANFVEIYLREMRDRSMRSGTELVWEIQLTDWSTANKPVLPVLWSTKNTAWYLYSFWALSVVLCEVQLDNKICYLVL